LLLRLQKRHVDVVDAQPIEVADGIRLLALAGCRDSSATTPAISTPVAPPPMITVVRQRWRTSSLSLRCQSASKNCTPNDTRA
jgi:hypothetical protein